MRDKKYMLVLIFLVGLAVLLGFTYANWRKGLVSSAVPSHTSQRTQKPDKSTVHTPQQAVSMVQSAYNALLVYVQQTPSANQKEVDTIKPYLSTTLYMSLSNQMAAGVEHDILLCAQAIPQAITTSLLAHSSSSATVLVSETFQDAPVQVVVTTDLDSLKITGISCA